jgi:hypothetical protein
MPATAIGKIGLRADSSHILTFALAAVPNMLAVLAGVLITSSRLTDLRSHGDNRFDEMRDLWRSELNRVEQVIDARLKRLEERGR